MIDRDGGGIMRRHPSFFSTAAILLFAVLLMVPEFLFGLTYTDSFRFNFVWTEQFSRQFLTGDLYPRWLQGSWDGLGSPAFYFYPPLYFWIASAARALSLGQLDAAAAATCATLAVQVVSGLAMRAWLSHHGGTRAALAGALAYMAAPYHLYDIFGRGALAEACSYALLPLILLSVKRLAEGRPCGIALALSYAALILAHLPSALLASVTIIPIYMIFCLQFLAGDRLAFCWRSALAILTGLGLAAAYLLPALTLLPHLATGALNGGYYVPENQFWWPISNVADPYRMAIIITVTIGALFLAIGAGSAAWSRRDDRRQALLWLGIVILGVIMISGAVPIIWHIAPLAQIQFPFRMLPIVEFATITLLVIGKPRISMLPYVLGLAALAFGMVLILQLAISMTDQSRREGAVALAYLGRFLPDAPEYLPQGHPIPLDREGRAYIDADILPRMSLAKSLERRASVKVWEANGVTRIDVDSPVASTVVARRFYFPNWHLTRIGKDVAPALVPWGERQLVSWQIPAGKSSYRLEAGHTPVERWGWAISIAVAACLGSLALIGRIRRKRV